MSRFFSEKYSALTVYTPGEQPRGRKYTKLNTNESPVPPPGAVFEAVADEINSLNLYCDPECTDLRRAAAQIYGVEPENILPVNGSDEILYFAFLAFGDESHPFAFPDISYGFYPIFADTNHIPTHIIPLKDDFTIDWRDYCGLGENIVIANPNAPTGILLPVDAIREIVRTNPDNVVIIDEAYIDFGGDSCVRLVHEFDNLLVTQTFSKSRSLAGARLGFGIGDQALIQDLQAIKDTINPYNVNRMTQAAGVAAIMSTNYYAKACRIIVDNREYTTKALRSMGFEVLPSMANFIFARSPDISGREYYEALRDRGVLVRHFDKDRIRDFTRITIGTREQMDTLLSATCQILLERGKKL